jgi:hypothetical protein
MPFLGLSIPAENLTKRRDMNAKLFKIQYTIRNGTQSETITVQASDQNAARYVFQALMPGVRLISGPSPV